MTSKRKELSALKTNLILILIAIIIIVAPLILIKGGEEEGKFGGSDGAGGDKVDEYMAEKIESGEYNKEWFKPIFEPKSGEIESLLFSVQVGIGALLVGYFIGTYREKAKNASD